MKVDAVVLAGGDGAVIDPTCRFKGLLPIAGKPMIEWVADALRASSLIAGIAAVMPTAENLGPWVSKVDKIVVSDAAFMENVQAGVSAFRIDRPVLIVTADLPVLTAEALDDFVGRSLEKGADFAYPLITRGVMLEQFPDGKRTFVRLDTGEVTGGNMMLVNPDLVTKNAAMGQRMFDARKSPAKLARLLGMRFVLKLAVGRLNVGEVEAKMGEILGGKGAALFTDHGSIGMDVDKPEDVAVVERLIADSARTG